MFNSGKAIVIRGIYTFGLITFLLLTSCGGEGDTIKINCDESGLKIQVTEVDYTDCGITNGRIRVSGIGGAAPYSFSINTGETNSTGVFENLNTNYYVVSVQDNNGCSAIVETFVGSNEEIRAVGYASVSGCNESNGVIVIAVRNGKEPYRYQLGENSDYQDSNEFYELGSGTYSVWVADANNCSIGIYVDVPSGISFENDIHGITNASCATASCHDGTISPDLSTLNGIQNNAQAVLSSIIDKSMPPDSPLTSDEIYQIECWIKDGAPDN